VQNIKPTDEHKAVPILQQSLWYQGVGGHTSKPVNVEGQITVLKPVLVNSLHGLWAVVKLVVDCEELLDLALGQALHVQVLPVLFRQLRFWLVEALQLNENVVRHTSNRMRKMENEPGMAEHGANSG
jgi:hypothetical protein